MPTPRSTWPTAATTPATARARCRCSTRCSPSVPAHPQAATGRAFALALTGDLPAAIAALERITAAARNDAVAWQTLGAVRNWAWQHGAAEVAFRHALALNPQSHDAAFGVASTLLARGNYAYGWPPSNSGPTAATDPVRRSPALPVWDGRAFDGTLVVYGEQGFGDVIQFARFIAGGARARRPRRAAARRLLARRSRRCSLRWRAWTTVVTRAEDVAARIAHATARVDPVVAAPPRHRRRAAPGPTRAMSPPPADRAQAWRARMAAVATPRVGLAWSVLPRDGHGFVTRHKSVPGDALAAVLATPDTTFVTLQPGAAGDPSGLPARCAAACSTPRRSARFRATPRR